VGEVEVFNVPGALKEFRGRYAVGAKYDANKKILRLKAGKWVRAVEGLKPANLKTEIDTENGTLTGKLGRRCTLEDVRRTSAAVAMVVTPKAVPEPEVDVKRTPVAAEVETEFGPVTGMTDLTGIWYGKERGSTFSKLSVAMDATPSGALLQIKKGISQCELVVSPTPGADGGYTGHAYKAKSASGCLKHKIKFGRYEDQLLVVVSDLSGVGALELRKFAGPDARAVQAPDFKIRGVALGQPLTRVLTAMPEPDESKTGVHQEDFSAAARGIRAKSPLLESHYVTGFWMKEDPLLKAARQDDAVSAYASSADGPVAAILRRFVPMSGTEPEFERTTEAVLAAYGPPTVARIKKTSARMEWDFDVFGKVLPEGDKTCRMLRSKGRDVVLKLRGEVVAEEVYPDLVCGYSLRIGIAKRTQDNKLRSLTAVAFDHRAVARQIWARDAAKVQEIVEGRLKRAVAGDFF